VRVACALLHFPNGCTIDARYRYAITNTDGGYPVHGPRSLTITAATLFLFFTLPLSRAQRQQPPQQTFTLAQTVQTALRTYPAIRASLEQVSAANSGITLAKTAYLPRVDMLWQGNRATRNNIFGLLLPQPVISSISGPVLPSASNQSVWGSAAGLLFSWEPFDFGRRGAAVNAARAGATLATSEVSVTRLNISMAAINAFFNLLAAQQRVSSARADVGRRQVFDEAVRTLVANQLRPGADASRADAELARARVLLIQGEQAEAVSRAALAEFLGVNANRVRIDPGPLLGPPPKSAAPAPRSQRILSPKPSKRKLIRS
jgi:outer membrane protein